MLYPSRLFDYFISLSLIFLAFFWLACEISIGSLGSENSEAHVSDVTVHGARLSGTTNGVRIKTWQVKNLSFPNVFPTVASSIYAGKNSSSALNPVLLQGAAGSVSNIKFQNIQVHDVQNPIIIDQNYCDQSTPCTQQVEDLILELSTKM